MQTENGRLRVDFVKMEGAGNDFIMIDGRDSHLPEGDFGRFAARWCQRKRGVGSDGLVVLLAASEAGHDFAMRFFNPDGTEAEMCGNGARCITLFAHKLGAAGEKMRFGTPAGPIDAEITEAQNAGLRTQNAGLRMGVKLRMPPASAIQEVPGINVADRKFDIFFANAGVPHAVVVVDDIQNVDVKQLGGAIRYHEHFKPGGINANFIAMTGENSIALRTYERGVEDETLACGTGACASALVANRVFGMESPVDVLTQGGDTLTIHFQLRSEDGSFPEVYLEGPAKEVFRGSVPW